MTTSRVLIVEDEPAENQFLTMTVRGLGHAAESCLDGQAAIAWLQQERPSLVLLDALLPKADGFAVLQEVRRLHPDVPVYMMSGVYKKKNYEQEAVGKMGATAYLHKPLGVLQIWEILERNLPPAPAGEVAGDFPGVPFWRRPLPAVIADLWSGSKTGLLFVRGTGGSAILFFEDGRLVFGRCSDPQLRLDRVLVQLGKLRKDQLPKVAEIVTQTRGRIGDALVAERLITADDLCEALALQQRNHVTRPLTWTKGSCWFHACDAPRHETFKMQLDVASLVFWAFRQLEVDEHLIRFLPRAERRLRLTRPGDELARPFGLSPEEVRLIDLADGRRSVGQIRSIGRMMQLDVDRILAALVALRLVEVEAESDVKASSTPFLGTSVPVAGDLARHPAALLLVSMAFGAKTGVLQLETAQAGGSMLQRSVHFENGAIAFATSSDVGDRIGQVLIRMGLLTREQLQEALAAAQATAGLALGRVLVDRGMLRPDDLHSALLQQAQQVVTGLVGWQSGTFRFQENDGPGRDIVPLGLDTRQALMVALRTCPFTDIAPRLPAPDSRLRITMVAHEISRDLPLTPLELRLRDEADGSLTVQENAHAAPEGPQAVLRAVFTLTTLGIVECFRMPAGATPPPPRVGPPAAAPAAAALAPPAAPSRRRMIALDEQFEGTGDNQDEDTREQRVAEDWSGAEDASFADVAASAAPAVPAMPFAVNPPLADTPTAEDWSGAEDASFAGLGEAVADAGGSFGFAFGSLDGAGDQPLPLGGDAWAQPARATGAAVGAATATAVACPPWTGERTAAVEEFLTTLADWLRACPEAVPESIRRKLPREIRDAFQL